MTIYLFSRQSSYPEEERTCCDGRCFQRNPSQGGSCPLDETPKESVTSRAVDIVFWVAGVALLSALIFAVLAPVQTGEIVATLLGLG